MNRLIKKFLTILTVAAGLSSFVVSTAAETITLKSSKVIEGKIIERTDDSIKIDAGTGVEITYYLDEIETISGKDVVYPASSEESKKIPDKQKANIKPESYSIQYSKTKSELIENDIKSFRKKIDLLLVSKNFRELESMAKKYRSNADFFPDGQIKLQQFYSGLRTIREETSITIVEHEIKYFEEWKEKISESVTARVALAAAHKDLGFLHRGSGYRSTVTEEGADLFGDQLSKAWDILIEAEALPEKDPHLYATKLSVCLGLKKEKEEIHEIVEKSLEEFPWYYESYSRMMIHLLPRWGGSTEASESFADWLTFQTEEEFGQQMYARYATKVLNYVGENDFGKFNFDWKKIKIGVLEVLDQYPHSKVNMHTFTWMASYYQDKPLSSALFKALGDDWGEVAENLWSNQENFDNWKTWAFSDVESIYDEIHQLVRQRDYEGMKEYIDNDGDLNSLDKDGNTPLILALHHLDVYSANLLIEAEADVTIMNKEGHDALYYAARYATPNIIQQLVDLGADVDRVYGDNQIKPIQFAAVQGDLENVMLLYDLNPQTLHYRSGGEITVFHHAAYNGHEHIVKFLLDQDKSIIDAKTDKDQTVLHFAAEEGHTTLVSLLLEYNASVGSKTLLKATPLDLALENEHTEVAELLKEYGAQQNKDYEIVIDADKANRHYIRGNDHYNHRRWKEAEEEFELAIEYNPQHASAYRDYALLMINGYNDGKNGLKNAKKALKLKPDLDYAYYAVGRAHDMLGHKEEAMKNYRKHIETDPDSPMTLDLLRRYPKLKK